MTWGFAAEGINIPGSRGEGSSPNQIRNFFNTSIGPQATTWQPLFEQVFQRWNSISGLDIQFEANDDGAFFGLLSPDGVLGLRADLRISAHPIDGPGNSGAYNFFPEFGGDTVIDSDAVHSSQTAPTTTADYET